MTDIASICVYCGSSEGNEPAFHTVAEAFGRSLAEAGIGLVYGGARIGLMGRLAMAALDAGGKVTGIIPGHIHEAEVALDSVSELIVINTMHERKNLMFEHADAFVTLPGGLGTLDETIEMVTWHQLGLHDKPVVIVNTKDYWGPLLGLVEHTIRHGFSPHEAIDYFHVVDTHEQVLPLLNALP